MNWLKKAYMDSVFYPLDMAAIKHTNEILAIYFHRIAAIQYLSFFVFGMTVLLSPYIWDFDSFADVAGTIIAPVSIVAAFGATYFPKRARLEMFAASSIVGLYFFYIVWAVFTLINEGRVVPPTLVLSICYALIPIARVTFVFRTLVNRAKREE